MKITVELPPDIEAELRRSVTSHDAEAIQRLLAEAFTPTIESLLREPSEELTDDEFDAVADQLAEGLDRCLGANAASLSDYAVSREGIYEDHL